MIGARKLLPRTVFPFLESCLGKHELISGRAREHRHHTDNEEGKALLTAETGIVGSQAESRVAAVRLSGGPRGGGGTDCSRFQSERARQVSGR